VGSRAELDAMAKRGNKQGRRRQEWREMKAVL